jgi:hypothetical protein
VPTDALRPALVAMCQALKRLRVPFMVIGGVAVQAHGYARATRDIDATIRGDRIPLEKLIASLKRSGIVPRVEDFEALATENFILLLEHRPTRTPIDLSLAWVDFEQNACERATGHRFGRLEVPIIRLDDLLVLKTIAWRERDQNDVRNLLSLRAEIDPAPIARQVQAIADLMDLDDRVPAFRALVAAVRPARKKGRGRPRPS